jgi:hypothetical protein
MRAETKKFIEERQPHAAKPLNVVDVKLVGGKRPNDCSNNALDVVEEMDGVRPITGWLVNPVNAFTGEVEILAHWWNADAKGNHFDTTPCMYNEAEYVEDLDLYMFAQKNYNAIDSIVASSLKYKDGSYIACEANLKVSRAIAERSISSLANKELFKL